MARIDFGPPKYSLEECNHFFPVLNPEQEALPWSKWKWSEKHERYKRSCVVPSSKRHLCIGMPYAPNQLFFEGKFVTSQTAELKVPRRPRSRKSIERAITNRLGRIPSEWKCFYCNYLGDENKGPDGRTWHVDHAYPVSLGGDDSQDNLVLSCATCNLRKLDKTALAFIATRNASDQAGK